MLESIFKYLSTVVSVKAALKSITFALLITLFWQRLTYYFALNNIPTEYAHVLTFLTAFALSFLTVEFIYCVVIYLRNQHIQWSESRVQARKKENENKILNNRLNAMLPHLDERQLGILKNLLHKNSVYVWHSENITNFQKSNFIQAVGKKNSREYVYRLNPQIKASLTSYLNGEREKLVVSTSGSLTDGEYQFLRIFFEDMVPFGAQEDTKWMPANIYSSKQKLIHNELISAQENDGIEHMTIASDFKERLIKDGHFDRCYREEVDLKQTLIEAPIAYRI